MSEPIFGVWVDASKEPVPDDGSWIVTATLRYERNFRDGEMVMITAVRARYPGTNLKPVDADVWMRIHPPPWLAADEPPRNPYGEVKTVPV